MRFVKFEQEPQVSGIPDHQLVGSSDSAELHPFPAFFCDILHRRELSPPYFVEPASNPAAVPVVHDNILAISKETIFFVKKWKKNESRLEKLLLCIIVHVCRKHRGHTRNHGGFFSYFRSGGDRDSCLYLNCDGGGRVAERT
ncbi:hypothetical protein SDC9_175449 [bioreactor metagenome]|uniref:Uncharacterized protein n=1 Tax=bioreactor metagenome TaxID=1076179 RepID=A0A645GMR1_9ZZZZ